MWLYVAYLTVSLTNTMCWRWPNLHFPVRMWWLLFQRLELSPGPWTADLGLRLGLYSGPTIASVLRGVKASFQLFGDTVCDPTLSGYCAVAFDWLFFSCTPVSNQVNTASRMESSSQPNKMQVSRKTAKLVVEAGKSFWLTARKI
jgi:class 3 adenylate cyclase